MPSNHLESGEKTSEVEGRVAFGSSAWELFRDLDKLRKGMPVDVYIYASDAEGNRQFAVSWRGRYVRHVESEGGKPPKDLAKYRPASTITDTDWALFWIVEDLQRLAPEECSSLASFTAYGKKKPYGHSFPPRGPLLIEHPL